MTDEPKEISISNMKWQNKSINDHAPVLQAWLYFGVLHDIFKDLLKTDYKWTDFVDKTESGDMFISNKLLLMSVSSVLV
jgi:hypothetical protein